MSALAARNYQPAIWQSPDPSSVGTPEKKVLKIGSSMEQMQDSLEGMQIKLGRAMDAATLRKAKVGEESELVQVCSEIAAVQVDLQRFRKVLEHHQMNNPAETQEVAQSTRKEMDSAGKGQASVQQVREEVPRQSTSGGKSRKQRKKNTTNYYAKQAQQGRTELGPK